MEGVVPKTLNWSALGAIKQGPSESPPELLDLLSDLEKAIVNISAELERVENSTTDAIKALQVEISSLRKVVLQNPMALDLLAAKEGGVGTVIKQSCCR